MLCRLLTVVVVCAGWVRGGVVSSATSALCSVWGSSSCSLTSGVACPESELSAPCTATSVLCSVGGSSGCSSAIGVACPELELSAPGIAVVC